MTVNVTKSRDHRLSKISHWLKKWVVLLTRSPKIRLIMWENCKRECCEKLHNMSWENVWQSRTFHAEITQVGRLENTTVSMAMAIWMWCAFLFVMVLCNACGPRALDHGESLNCFLVSWPLVITLIISISACGVDSQSTHYFATSHVSTLSESWNVHWVILSICAH